MKYCIFLFFAVCFPATVSAQENTNSYRLDASDGLFTDKATLKWDSVPKADFYEITRLYNGAHITKKGKNIVITADVIATNLKTPSFSDNKIPFGQYKYTVTAYQMSVSNNQTNNIPIAVMTDLGHRQVSDKEFFLEFQKSIDSSLPRIRTMKMLNFIGENQKGWKNGSLVYKTTGIIKRPFKVMITYKDFIDHVLSLNGTYEVQLFKLIKQEGKLIGTFLVDGIYKGTVTHNLIIEKGRSVGGFYEVQQQGKPKVQLPWDVTEHPLDDSQYEDALKQIKED
ncbi:MAG: hypothetical protein ACRCTQ_04240 [Brevinemataceae bacterium]